MKKTTILKTIVLVVAMMLGGQAWADVDFGTESTVSAEKTWTFSGNTQYKAVTEIGDGLYVRGSNGRSLSVTALGSTERITFSDGYVVDVNASLLAANEASGSTPATAGAGSGILGTVALNINTPGTLYVKVKASNQTNWETEPRLRIQESGATKDQVKPTDETTLYELKYSFTEACVAYLATAGKTFLNIYAIHFVPKTVLDNTETMVYIGATGYASFGNNTGSHLVLPDGLNAYKAKADTGGHSVTLTSVPGIRSAAGYILKGTANTNYRLASTTTDPGGNSETELKRASSAMENFAAQDGSNYRYILGADGNVAKFFAPNGTSTLAAGKAYLETTTQLTPAPSARGISIIFEDDETTGVTNVNLNANLNSKYYNLQGVEVFQPTKGLYIVNGKKVIIK